MKDTMARLRMLNKETHAYKKRYSKEEVIYVMSTYSYATQGIFKVGRTKNIRARLNTHNSSHPNGDKMHVLAEFKVNDAQYAERILLGKLRGLVHAQETEWILCPFNLLYQLIECALDQDDRLNRLADEIIDMVNELRTQTFNMSRWIEGIDMSVFGVENPESNEIQLVSSSSDVLARFDVTNATNDQKQAFVRECMDAYKRTIIHPLEVNVLQVTWKAFQGFLIQQLNIPKSKFKATEWKDYVANTRDDSLQIKWRSS